MEQLPAIWKALIERNTLRLKTIMTRHSSNANIRHPVSGKLILDTALEWGYLEEAKILCIYDTKYENPPLASGCISGNIELLEWIYSNMDNDVNNSQIVNNIFSPTKTTDEDKYKIFQFMLNHGADYHPYILNSIMSSPLITKYLVDNDMLDLSTIIESNKSVLDELQLRNISHPYTIYLKPNKTNELFVAVTNNESKC